MGRLKLEAWRHIGAPDHILEWIEHGVKVPFRKGPPEPIWLQNRVQGAREFNFVDSKLKDLLDQGAIKKVNFKPQCVLPIQIVPKKNGKLRLVVDCRHSNSFIKTPKFKQEGIESVAAQIQEGDLLISVDLQDGFHHVEMHHSCWTYFGMSWRNEFYVWCVLPFGMAASPWFFKKILEPVSQYLREQGLRIALFVDDFFQMAKKLFFQGHKELLLDTLTDLGWSINRDKSQLTPNTCCSFVGFDVCSIGLQGPWIKVMHDKVRKLKSYIRRALSKPIIQARQLAKIAGMCIAMTRAVIPAKLLLRNIYRCIATKTSWNAFITLDKHARNDLLWWLNAIQQWNGTPLFVTPPEIQCETDASASGWGGCIPSLNLEASGTWNKEVSFKHSNYRELLTVLIVIKSFLPHLKNKSVQVLSDNVTAVAYINHLGGRDKEFNDVVTALFTLCLENGIRLTAKHLAGDLNFRADLLSRQMSPYEWRLHPALFKALDIAWGPHTVDRFASWRTAQLPVYNSYFADPYTSGVDAFAQQWSNHINFLNPPFFLLNRVIDKVIKDRAAATIIAPMWPNQPWYAKLKRIMPQNNP